MDPVGKKTFSEPSITEEASLTEVTLQSECPPEQPF
jgi:hypothetical protein